jgi:lipase
VLELERARVPFPWHGERLASVAVAGLGICVVGAGRYPSPDETSGYRGERSRLGERIIMREAGQMPADVEYSRLVVPVRGGSMVVGTWGEPYAPPVVALPGLVDSHLVWSSVGRIAGRYSRFIATDLRGRAGSAQLPGPWGVRQHASDVIALLDTLGIERGALLGYSMGGFLALAIHQLHPDRVSGVVLVDGGLPPARARERDDDISRAVRKAVTAELGTVFPSRRAYREFRRRQLPPSVTWTNLLSEAADYELLAMADGYRMAGSLTAIMADIEYISGPEPEEALRALSVPAVLLRAPRGLPPRESGLYSADTTRYWTHEVPLLSAVDVHGEDHASILLSAAGIEAVTAATMSLVAPG